MGWFAKVTTQIATIIINNNHHNSLQLKNLPQVLTLNQTNLFQRLTVTNRLLNFNELLH